MVVVIKKQMVHHLKKFFLLLLFQHYERLKLLKQVTMLELGDFVAVQF